MKKNKFVVNNCDDIYIITNLKIVASLFGNDVLFKKHHRDRKRVNKMILSSILKRMDEPIFMYKYWHFDIDHMELFLQFYEKPVISFLLSCDYPIYNYGILEPGCKNFKIENRKDLLPSFISQDEFAVYAKKIIKRFKKEFPLWQEDLVKQNNNK